MASAQLSSPHPAGAGSDLREAAPAGRPFSLGAQLCSGSSNAGRRALAAPGHFSGRRPRPGRSGPPGRACPPAPPGLPESHAAPVLPRGPARPAPPPSPQLPSAGGGCSAWIGQDMDLPIAPPQSRVQHSWVVPGPESGNPAGSGLGAPPETWAKLGSGAAGPGAEPEPAQQGRHSGRPFPPAAQPRERPTGRAAGDKVHFRRGGAGGGGARARTGVGPSRGRWLQAQAARSARNRCEPARPRLAVRVLPAAELQARPAPTSSVPAGHAPTAPATGLPPGSRPGSGRGHAPVQAGGRKNLSPADLGPAGKEARGAGSRDSPGGGTWKVQ